LNKNIVGSARIINNSRIQGWFFSKEDINNPLSFELYINNKKITHLTANNFRKDIVSKNIHPTGKVGFVYDCNVYEFDDVYLNFTDFDYKFIVQKGFNVDKSIRKRELCIVHIGMHKTGSSSIQYNLSRRQYKNFSYFNLGTENHSIPIFSLFSKKPENYHIHWRAGRTKEDVKKYNQKVEKLFLKHLIDNEEHEVFVISGEDISMLPIESVHRFKDFLSCYFKNIKIIAYVRSPGSFMSSNFQEHIKAGFSNFNVDIHYPNYRSRFEKFDEIFGKENVQLIHFDLKKIINNDVTCDFLNRLGLDDKIVTYDRINESLSLEATSLLYIFNKYASSEFEIVEREKNRMKLIEFLKKIGKQKFMLKPDVIKEVIKKNKDDIEWIEKRIGIKISEEPFNHSDGVSCEKDMYNIAKRFFNNLGSTQYKDLNNIININSLKAYLEKR